MLQHGSILVEDDQPLVAALADTTLASPQPAATLAESLGRSPDVTEVATALFDAVRSAECATADELPIDSALHDATQRLLSRYVDDCWTWRR